MVIGVSNVSDVSGERANVVQVSELMRRTFSRFLVKREGYWLMIG